ncbi:hypothetical protein ANO14919_140470 [Xylariales sp. No.14919]|nr:hypothetical protein ANO14919_140470 [Xylariales sp. No.14919]
MVAWPPPAALSTAERWIPPSPSASSTIAVELRNSFEGPVCSSRGYSSLQRINLSNNSRMVNKPSSPRTLVTEGLENAVIKIWLIDLAAVYCKLVMPRPIFHAVSYEVVFRVPIRHWLSGEGNKVSEAATGGD